MTNTPLKEYKESSSVSFKYARGDIDILSRCFHEYYELYMLLDGDVTYVSEQGSYTLNPYDLVVVRPHEYHHFNINGDIDRYTRYVLQLYPSAFENKEIRTILDSREIYHLSSDDPIVQNFTRLRRYGADGYSGDYNALIRCVTEETILLLKYTDHKDQELKSKKTPWILNQALQYIQDHLSTPFTLSDIAAVCHTSPSTLSHTFREYYGISVMKYVGAKRLGLANELLASGFSPGEVYRQCGYSDYTTFYRAYKQYYKRAPSK